MQSFSLNFFDSNSSWVITTSTGKPDHPTDRFSGLMGLDGIFRKSPPAPYGINASKGRWLNGHTLPSNADLGHSETQTWTLAFDGNRVNVSFANTDGAKAELHGERKD